MIQNKQHRISVRAKHGKQTNTGIIRHANVIVAELNYTIDSKDLKYHLNSVKDDSQNLLAGSVMLVIRGVADSPSRDLKKDKLTICHDFSILCHRSRFQMNYEVFLLVK